MGTSLRKQLFISHAAPDDNIVAQWLSARLAAYGYETWVDVDVLRGGEAFWLDIQKAIGESARVLVLISKKSVSRDGVLNEIAEAQAVAKKLGDSKFLVPMRIDDISWDDLPIQLKQLHGIDFAPDWGVGLTQLVDSLDRAHIAKGVPNRELERVCGLYVASRSQIVAAPDLLLSNWLPINSLPTRIHAYRSALSSSELRSRREQVSFPFELYERLLLTFAEPSFVAEAAPGEFGLQHAYDMELGQFFSGKPPNAPEFGAPESGKIMTSLIRQGWASLATAAGLKLHWSGDSPRWFVPKGWVPNDKVYFTDATGRRGWRLLDGKAKALHWHYAVAVRARLFEPRCLQLTAHVLFSEDGTQPLNDQKLLRRRHCKLWWNDKWRDLLLAFLQHLFPDASAEARIPLGGSAAISIAPSPMSFQLPVSYSTDEAHLTTEEEAEGLDREEGEEEDAGVDA